MANLQTGSLTTGDTVVTASPMDNIGTAGFIITGTWVGTITFEGSLDGTNFVTIYAQNISTNVLVQTTTVNGQFLISASGFYAVRVRMSSYTSGTANVIVQGTGSTYLSRSLTTQVGATDATHIGNVGDSLKTTISNTVTSPIPIQFTSTGLDAFGRLRVSEPVTIFETGFPIDAQPLLFSSSTATGGTVTYNANKTSVDLATTTSSGSKAIYQTRRYFPYHPGKSHLLIITGNLGGQQANVRKRAGLFDVNNGVFFEMNGTTPNCVVRSKVSGSVVDTQIPQSSWNLDKLDGTGTSGINIDWTKQQLLFVDMQWLGSGSIRFGTIIGGAIIYAHQVNNANIISTPWAQFATWPIRCEIENLAGIGAGVTATLTCATLISEGGWGPEGILRTASNGTSSKAFGTAGSTIPILSIRKKAANVTFPIKIEDLSVFINSADDFLIKIIINGTLTAASWVAATGIAEIDTSATAISGGQEVYSFYLRGSTGANSSQISDIFRDAQNIYLGSDLSSNSDIFSVVGVNITASANASVALNYREMI